MTHKLVIYTPETDVLSDYGSNSTCNVCAMLLLFSGKTMLRNVIAKFFEEAGSPPGEKDLKLLSDVFKEFASKIRMKQ